MGEGGYTFEVWEAEFLLGDAVGGEFQVVVRILYEFMGYGMEKLKVKLYLCFHTRFRS